MTYNYSRFTTSFYDLASFEGPGVGEAVPDFDLTLPDGESIRLHELLDRPLVLETGSVTCPMYGKGVSAMTEMAARHPEARFAVLYVREAHPGERVGAHATATDKRRAAKSLADVMTETRQIIVDDIDGTAHQALGSLPDMVYVIGTDGVVRFRGDWNDPSIVEEVLSGTASDDTIRREHYPPTKPSPGFAIRVLMVGGLKAVLDFLVGLPGLLRLHRRADHAYRDTDGGDPG